MAGTQGEDKRDGTLLRILNLLVETDWKSVALLLTWMGGGAGYAIDWVDDLRASRTQSAAYDILATRLEELTERVEQCEHHHDEKAAPVPAPKPTPKPKPKRPKPTPPQEPAAEPPAPLPAAAEIMVATEGEVVSYKKARLPRFDQIQQRANAELELEQFMEEMKAR